MKKYYRNAVINEKTGQRDTYISERQGAAPAGWKNNGVCGFFETDKKVDLTWENRHFFQVQKPSVRSRTERIKAYSEGLSVSMMY